MVVRRIGRVSGPPALALVAAVLCQPGPAVGQGLPSHAAPTARTGQSAIIHVDPSVFVDQTNAAYAQVSQLSGFVRAFPASHVLDMEASLIAHGAPSGVTYHFTRAPNTPANAAPFNLHLRTTVDCTGNGTGCPITMYWWP